MERKQIAKKRIIRRILAVLLAVIMTVPNSAIVNKLGLGTIELQAEEGGHLELVVFGGTISNPGDGWVEHPFDNGEGAYYVFEGENGTVVALPTPTPIKSSDEFDGWYVRNDDGSKGQKYTGSTYTISEYTTLDAYWKSESSSGDDQNRGSLELVVRGGSISNLGEGWNTYTSGDGDVVFYVYDGEIGTVVTLPTPTKTGEEFSGWYLRDDDNNLWVQKYTGSTYTLSRYTIMDSRWKSQDAKEIRLFLDGGKVTENGWTKVDYTWEDGSGNVTTWYSFKSADEPVVTLPTPVKEGCVFKGWKWWDSSTQKDIDYEGSTYKLTENRDFSAVFEDNRVTLRLWTDEGTIDNTDNKWDFYEGINGGGYHITSYSIKVEKGTEITLPTPEKENYEFAGWEIWDETKEEWADYTSTNCTLTQDMELVARWKSNSGVDDNNVQLTLWTSEGIIENSDNKWEFNEGISGDGDRYTVYSMWVPKETEITLPTPTKENDEFLGWFIVNGDSDWKKLPGNTITLTQDTELSASWKSDYESDDNTPRLRLFTDGGTIDNSDNKWEYYDGSNGDGFRITSYSINVEKGTEIAIPTPVKENDEFYCWEYRDEATGKIVEYTGSTCTLTQSMDLSARWKSTKTFMLELQANGGIISGLGQEWHEYANSVTGKKIYGVERFWKTEITLPVPTKENDEFMGWWYYDETQGKNVEYTNPKYIFEKYRQLEAHWKSDVPVAAEGIQIDPATISVEEEKTAALTAILLPATQNENPVISWTSSDNAVATVSDGVVTGVKEGNATITASIRGEKGDFSATCEVTVTKKIVPVSDIVLSSNALSILKGETATLTASVLPEDATDKTIEWNVGNPKIATVADGVVTGVSAGVTSVVVKAGDITAAVIVTVTESAKEDEEEIDLTHIMEDTGMGENIEDVISAVVEVTVDENGEETTETKIWIGGIQSSYTYTGAKIQPEIHVYDGIKELSASDYSVSYKDNVNAGSNAQVTVKFKGNYKDTPSETVNFTIVPADLGKDFVAEDVVLKATGKTLKASPKITWASTGKALSGKLYEVKISGELKDAGTYEAVFTSKTTNITGIAKSVITVVGDQNRDLGKGSVKVPDKVVWTGEEITFDAKDIAVKDKKGQTVDPAYYDVTYANNTDPGKATLTVYANDPREEGYIGSKSVTFKIEKGKNDQNVEFEIEESVPYSKAGAKAAVSALDKDTGEYLVNGVDYTVSYKKNTAPTGGAKTAEAIVKGKGNYKFTKTLNYAVTGKDLGEVAVKAADVVGAAKWNKYKLVLTDDGKKLGAKDYAVESLTGSDGEVLSSAPADGVVIINIKEGTSGMYSGETQVSYRVIEKSQDISKAKILKSGKNMITKTYTGSAVTLNDADLTGLVSVGGVNLVPGLDFKVVGYENNLKTGKAKATIVGLSGTDVYGKPVGFGGTKTITFKIVNKTGSWNKSGKAFVDGAWK